MNKTILSPRLPIAPWLRNSFLTTILAVAICIGGTHEPHARPSELVVENIRLRPGIGNRPGIVHLTLHNKTAHEIRIYKITSRDFKSIALHTHRMDGDIMRMRPVNAFIIPPHDVLHLHPHGAHLMLFDATSPLPENITLRLHYQIDGRNQMQDIETQPLTQHRRHHHKN